VFFDQGCEVCHAVGQQFDELDGVGKLASAHG